VTRLKND